MRVVNTVVDRKILNKGYKKFRYSFSKILLTILLFPLVYRNSKKYQKLFFRFCFTYKRNGTIKINDQKVIDVNSFEYHYYDIHEKQLNKYNYPIDFNSQNYQEFIIKNGNNQDISCLSIIHKNPSSKWVIGFHGWTENKYLALRLVSWFYQQGYNVLTFDSMAHGQSYGQYSDIGLTCAQQDVKYLIQWIKDNHQVTNIGLIGNSMGAATINQYLLNSNSKDISWAIADCGFSSLLVQYRYVMQYRFKKPWWLISYGLAKNYQTFSQTNIKNYDLIKRAKKGFKVPTLLIHGKEDDFVPFFMSDMIHKYQKKYNYKNYDYLFLDNVGHVEALPKAYDDYIDKIKQFINKYENK